MALNGGSKSLSHRLRTPIIYLKIVIRNFFHFHFIVLPPSSALIELIRNKFLAISFPAKFARRFEFQISKENMKF